MQKIRCTQCDTRRSTQWLPTSDGPQEMDQVNEISNQRLLIPGAIQTNAVLNALFLARIFFYYCQNLSNGKNTPRPESNGLYLEKNKHLFRLCILKNEKPHWLKSHLPIIWKQHKLLKNTLWIIWEWNSRKFENHKLHIFLNEKSV